jgi:coenzyme Q-binding protein COQ10
MPRHTEKRHLPFSAEQLFAIVSDVKSYPEFLPWCTGARVYNVREGQFDADLLIGYKQFKERFTSRVTIEEPTKVYVDYLRGPLKHLYNHWHFLPQEDGSCIIDFDVDLEFNSSMLEFAIRRYFDEATKKMIAAFEDRAKRIYGN